MALNTCVACKKTYKLDETNAVVFLYLDRTYMDNVHMTCENGHNEVLFFVDHDQRDRFLRNNDNLTVVREESPAEDVIESYQRVFDIVLVTPLSMSPRQERMVAELGAVLAATPDEMLLELFSHPPPKSNLPRRWSQ